MNEQGCVNRSGLVGADIKEFILRERAKNIFAILNQCHVTMDDLIGGGSEPSNNVALIPTGHISELQEQLGAIEIFAGELNARLQRLTEKI